MGGGSRSTRREQVAAIFLWLRDYLRSFSVTNLPLLSLFLPPESRRDQLLRPPLHISTSPLSSYIILIGFFCDCFTMLRPFFSFSVGFHPSPLRSSPFLSVPLRSSPKFAFIVLPRLGLVSMTDVFAAQYAFVWIIFTCNHCRFWVQFLDDLQWQLNIEFIKFYCFHLYLSSPICCRYLNLTSFKQSFLLFSWFDQVSIHFWEDCQPLFPSHNSISYFTRIFSIFFRWFSFNFLLEKIWQFRWQLVHDFHSKIP